MMKIILVRHGETDWNVAKRAQGRTDIPLNEKGIQQARETAEKLKDIPIHFTYTSPSMRAAKTAQIILENRDVPLETDSGLLERSFGQYEGKTWEEQKEIEKDYEKNQDTLGVDWRPPEGESYRETFERAVRVFNEICNKHKDNETLLLVTHGGIVRSVAHHAHGGKVEDIFHSNRIDNTAILELELKGDKIEVLRFEGKLKPYL